jgi:hypothetical protein
MKPHHAAVLALVGWALICPPSVENGPDIGAPITEWAVMRRGLAAVRECEQYRDHGKISIGIATEDRLVIQNAPLEFRGQCRCTPDDDPRLKGKKDAPLFYLGHLWAD